MKKLLTIISIALLMSPVGFSQPGSYLRGKVADKMIDKALDNAFGTDSEKKSDSDQSTEKNSDKPSQNSDSEGLSADATDVPAVLDKASADFNAKAYKEARASLKKAMKALEQKVGEQLLASLPETIKDLPANKEDDNITPSGVNMAGFTVHREYEKGDKYAAITIYNGSMASLTQQSVNYAEENENQKSIRIKNRDGVINFSSSSGYSISLASGQQTHIIIEGVNIKTESDMIAIAESFDYDNIGKILGDK